MRGTGGSKLRAYIKKQVVRKKGENVYLKIDSATIGMESERNYQSVKTSYRRFTMKEYQGGILNANSYQNGGLNAQSDAKDAKDTKSAGDAQDTNGKTSVEGNEEGTRLYTLKDWQSGLSVRGNRLNIRTTASDNTWNEFRQQTVRYIFRLLFGDRSDRIDELMEKYGLTSESPDSQGAQGQISSAGQAQSLNAQGIQTATFRPATIKQYQYTEETYVHEQEATSFSTMGTVRTADGREINFNVNVGMSREFTRTFSQDLNLSFTMCDPLVINLDTDVASLSDQKFYFDIDADGELDEVSQLGNGSGYLALDKNDDGVINDGNELFGTSSGNGFADLAKYDEDGNGWIDENDAIWTKLKIWTKDENGKDVLYRLADKGVGAICLQNAATDFTMQGADGRTNGAIRNTGVFLYENGNVGTVQHVDVAKYEHTA